MTWSASDTRQIERQTSGISGDPGGRAVILLRGGFHRNRGDEMMAVAVRDVVSNAIPGAVFARELYTGTFDDRARYGYRQLLWDATPFRLAGTLGFLALRRYGTAFGIVTPKEVSSVVDVSGFCYTDEWPQDNLERIVRQFERWHRRGLPIVLMPQSFGPFRRPATINCMNRIADCADLIFARDTISRESLDGCLGPRPNVRTAPDFTCLLRPIPPDPCAFADPYGCIVPNFRIVERGKATRERYCDLLCDAVRRLVECGLEPILLLHAPEQDRSLATSVQQMIGMPIRVADNRDPRELKGILGGARIVVGSRFHALVSALSQAVPTVGIGWTHKFQELFRSYNCSGNLLGSCDDEVALLRCIQDCLDASVRKDLIARLEESSLQIKQATARMWAEVLAVLGRS